MHPLANQSTFVEGGGPDPVGLSVWIDSIRSAGDDGFWHYRPVGERRYGIDGREVTREEFEREAARRGLKLE